MFTPYTRAMRRFEKIIMSAWVLFIAGCSASTKVAPQAADSQTAASQTATPQTAASNDAKGVSGEAPSVGPCRDAPPADQVLEEAERARAFANELDEYLRSLGTPAAPPAPYTVQRAEDWILKIGQPWFDEQSQKAAAFEARLDEFPVGTFARARVTVSIAAIWDYLSKRKAQIPKSAEKNYDVRVAYLGAWPRYQKKPLSDHAHAWLHRAQRAASEWGMIEVGVRRSWLTGKASAFLREPFPPTGREGFASDRLPGAVEKEVTDPAWPETADEVLEIGPLGLTPRQLACAHRFENDARVRHVLGRYYTTRALMFRDASAGRQGVRLLEGDASPAAVVDRALLTWVLASDEVRRDTDAESMAAWFDELPPQHISRRRLAFNLMRGYGTLPPVDDLGPPVEALPPLEQPMASPFGSGALNDPQGDFPWWQAPAPRHPGQNLGRIEGVRVDLSDGSYFIIPYSDDGLDYCAMVLVEKNGQRSPHRPPDVRKKCAARWAQ